MLSCVVLGRMVLTCVKDEQHATCTKCCAPDATHTPVYVRRVKHGTGHARLPCGVAGCDGVRAVLRSFALQASSAHRRWSDHPILAHRQVQNSPRIYGKTKVIPKAGTRFSTLGRRPKAIHTLTVVGITSDRRELGYAVICVLDYTPWPPAGSHERPATPIIASRYSASTLVPRCHARRRTVVSKQERRCARVASR